MEPLLINMNNKLFDIVRILQAPTLNGMYNKKKAKVHAS